MTDNRSGAAISSSALIRAVLVWIGILVCGTVALAIFAPGGTTGTLAVIVGLISPTVVALIALLQVQLTNHKVDELHALVNSRMTELLAKEREAATLRAREEAALVAKEIAERVVADRERLAGEVTADREKLAGEVAEDKVKEARRK